MKRQYSGLNSNLSKKPFDLRKFSTDSESSDALDLSTASFQSDRESPPRDLDCVFALDEDSSDPGLITVTKFVDICAAKPNLSIYGHNFTIPCHDFPICAKSDSLARLIQQPANEKKQRFHFDDKVSVDVASEFLTRCYNWECSWNISDPYDYIQLYFLIDMHFSKADRELFLKELQMHIKCRLEQFRIRLSQLKDKESMKKIDEQGAHFFFIAYELKLDLSNKTWMMFLTHFRIAEARAKLSIAHLDFLSTKRRPQDYRINQRFFKFLLNLCIHGNFKWENFSYDWAEVTLKDMKSVSRWLERQTPKHKTMVLDIYGHVMHSVLHQGNEESI